MRPSCVVVLDFGSRKATDRSKHGVGLLTKKQHDLLLFINQRLNEQGVSPSFDEMKEALGLRSKSGIHRLITGLEERGFIRRLPHRARALEISRLPENVAAPAPAAKPAAATGAG